MNLYLFDFAIKSLIRQKKKNVFIVIIYILLVFLLSSIFFISSSIKQDLLKSVSFMPEIIIENQVGGRLDLIKDDIVDELLEIEGISEIIPRVWGYYYSYSTNSNFVIIGLNEYDLTTLKSLANISVNYNLENSIVIGENVKKILKRNFYTNYFNFFTPDNKVIKLNIKGIFKAETKLFSDDVIIMSQENARKILGIKDGFFTDIAIKIPNPLEVRNIKDKILKKYLNYKVITKDDIKRKYESIFNYKGGIFLSLFIVSLFTFFLIIYDRINSILSSEAKEIAILKAIGWKIEDIILEKLYESFILSLFSFLVGIIISIYYVYILNAPFIKYIFVNSDINIDFYFDINTILIIFLLSVPIFIFATIIPSWRVAVKDADEVIR